MRTSIVRKFAFFSTLSAYDHNSDRILLFTSRSAIACCARAAPMLSHRHRSALLGQYSILPSMRQLVTPYAHAARRIQVQYSIVLASKAQISRMMTRKLLIRPTCITPLTTRYRFGVRVIALMPWRYTMLLFIILLIDTSMGEFVRYVLLAQKPRF